MTYKEKLNQKKRAQELDFYGADSQFPPKAVGRYTILTDIQTHCEHIFREGESREILSAAHIVDLNESNDTAIISCPYEGEYECYDLTDGALFFITSDLPYARVVAPSAELKHFVF